MVDVEIGIGKSARRAYRLGEIAVVPSRRTRDANDVDISWQLDAYHFDLPFVSAPRDGIVGPKSACLIDASGGLACMDLEGLWTRYESAEAILDELAGLAEGAFTRRLQELYAAPVRPELVTERLREVSERGAVVCGAVTPQHAEELVPAATEGGLDVLVIAGTTISAEHVSRAKAPLDLARFVRELDLPVIVGGCSSYQAALHLMRTGAVGVLVGVGPGEEAEATRLALGVGAPMATAIADAAGARSRHLEETGVYVHVVADAGIERGGDLAAAIACGADAVMLAAPLAAADEAPGHGVLFAPASGHATLPRGGRRLVEAVGPLEEVLVGPAHRGDGRANLFGGLRSAMAMSGYATIREFHKAAVVVGSAIADDDGGPERP